MEEGTIADIGLMLDRMNLDELAPSLWLGSSGLEPREYRLESGGNPWLIGRSDDSCVALPADEGVISRVHLRIERTGSCYSISDLSRNGTRVNGEAIVYRRLEDGDQITFGSVSPERLRLIFRHAIPTPPPRRSLEVTVIDAPTIGRNESWAHAAGEPNPDSAAPVPTPEPDSAGMNAAEAGRPPGRVSGRAAAAKAEPPDAWDTAQRRLLGLTLAAALLGAMLLVLGS